MISNELLQAILKGYVLSPWGIHGLSHWARVLENGRRLAAVNGAILEVVELFAVLHDARRENEGMDPGHGRRGADLAALLRYPFIQLDDPVISTRSITPVHTTRTARSTAASPCAAAGMLIDSTFSGWGYIPTLPGLPPTPATTRTSSAGP